MSGTALETIVLHVAPDAASGDPFGLIRNGDRIRLSVQARTIELLVTVEELERRAAERPRSTVSPAARSYSKLHQDQILQADDGFDIEFQRA